MDELKYRQSDQYTDGKNVIGQNISVRRALLQSLEYLSIINYKHTQVLTFCLVFVDYSTKRDDRMIRLFFYWP